MSFQSKFLPKKKTDFESAFDEKKEIDTNGVKIFIGTAARTVVDFD